MASLHIIYASSSGHTEHVAKTLADALREQGMTVGIQRVEEADLQDLKKGDTLILASSTWNTGGIEGQLNPHMDLFTNKRAKDADFSGRKVAVIGLGDARYRYTCKAADRLEEFVKSHGGSLLCETLRIVNEPWGQEEKVRAWGKELLSNLQ